MDVRNLNVFVLNFVLDFAFLTCSPPLSNPRVSPNGREYQISAPGDISRVAASYVNVNGHIWKASQKWDRLCSYTSKRIAWKIVIRQCWRTHVYDAIQGRMFFYERTFEKVRESLLLDRTQYITPYSCCAFIYIYVCILSTLVVAQRKSLTRALKENNQVLRKLLAQHTQRNKIKEYARMYDLPTKYNACLRCSFCCYTLLDLFAS